MTREALDQALGRMVVLRGMPGSSDEYWTVFESYDEDVVQAGISHAVRTRTFFPVPAELREDCRLATPAEPAYEPPAAQWSVGEPRIIKNPFGGKDLVVTEYRLWKNNCDTCSDTGWQSFWCGTADEVPPYDWMVRCHCGRTWPHGSHEFVLPCPCAATNPAVRRRRERMARP